MKNISTNTAPKANSPPDMAEMVGCMYLGRVCVSHRHVEQGKVASIIDRLTETEMVQSQSARPARQRSTGAYTRPAEESGGGWRRWQLGEQRPRA